MDDKQAVSPIISMILLIGIVLVVTTVILSWAAPLLQRSQSEANYGSASGYFNALDSALKDVVNMGEGASRTVDVSVGAGNIYMGETMNETWIVSYNFEGQPRVNISGLEDESKETHDGKFTVDSTPSQNVNVTVYKVEDNKFRNICKDGYASGMTLITVSATERITGTIYIRVNNSDNTETLAELWLFDITPISYELPSAFGTYYIKSVNGGIITQATGEKYVTDAPFIKETKNSILLYMVQTKTADTSLTGGGPGHYSFALKNMNMNIRNNISADVYNLTLQIYDKQGDKWNKAWYSYFESNFGFENEGNSLLYNNKIKLKLVQCNIDVNMESK